MITACYWIPFSILCVRWKKRKPSSPCEFGVVRAARSLLTLGLPRYSFFTHLQTYAGFLDVHLHTVEFVRGRSALLLSAILLAAARHDTTNPAARGIAERSKEHIDTVVWPAVLLSSHRSIQAVQGCMLLASWRAGNGRRDEDSSWTLFGHARECSFALSCACR